MDCVNRPYHAAQPSIGEPEGLGEEARGRSGRAWGGGGKWQDGHHNFPVSIGNCDSILHSGSVCWSFLTPFSVT